MRHADKQRGRPCRAAGVEAATDVEVLRKELDRLRVENRGLRNALAGVQNCSPEEVRFDMPGGAEAYSAPQGGMVPLQFLTSGVRHTATTLEGDDLMRALEGGIIWPSAGGDDNRPFWEREPRREPLFVGGMETRTATRDQRSLHVVHMTAEMAPCAKVGGLGDVVTGLARASLARGHNVEVMLPYYECLPDEQVEDLNLAAEFECPRGRCWDGEFQPSSLKTLVFSGKIDGIPVLLVRPDWDATNIFKGGRIYGGSYNELEAYLYFCRACLEFLRVTGRQPHLIHTHEWQTAAVGMIYWDVYHAQGALYRSRVMMTIHNFDSPGECRQDEFAFTGVPGEQFATVEKALDERTIGHNPERLSLLKGGMVYSNAVTTVSPTYATEALQGGAAGWLRSTLAKPDVSSKFHGVLNGIDTDMWDPSNDELLPATYRPSAMGGKRLCKRFLQEGLGLDVDPSKPLVACITRLVPQKGIHLIRHAIYRTKELGGQFVLLGSGHADGEFKAMADGEFKDHPDVRLMIMYSERLAHVMYGAADMVLVPSMFEPCGLTQLIAMRYGAVPVVRATGGLADTVKDVDDESSDPGIPGNGFSFGGVDEGSLNSALDRAVQYYRERGEWWGELSRRNMGIDTSWNRAAQSYVKLYADIAAPN